MAKRKFVLPNIQDLSKEQEKVRALPKEGRHLVIGGPGTGKSVLALLRSKRHVDDGDAYVFLVFNHLLERASGQLFGPGLASKTWRSWFFRTFRSLADSPVPLLETGSKNFREIDWEGVDEIIRNLPAEEGQSCPFLVIDEGQDMPPQFYNALLELDLNRFFVLADQNQQILETNSSRQDIEASLVIETADVIELRQNYRNNYSVARLAREFYTGDPASPPPELPSRSHGSVPILYEYGGNDLNAVAQRILRRADRDTGTLIGVIAPNDHVRDRYLKALRTTDVRLDNPRANVVTFFGQNRPDVAFDEGGILVINAQACKGLEFDVVILADIDEHLVRRQDPDHVKRLFYVMVARAKKQVFMFRKKDGRKDILNVLPRDQDVLRCEEI